MTYSYVPNLDLGECLAYAAHPEGDNIIYSRHPFRRGRRVQTLDRTFLLISEKGDERRKQTAFNFQRTETL